MNEKYYDVTNEEYKKFIDFASEYIKFWKKYKPVKLVSIYRGSLVMGVHLSNLHNIPLSIIKYQSYDGSDDVVTEIYSEIKNGDWIVILDDIYDTGKTMNKCIDFIHEKFPNSICTQITMFGKKSSCIYFKEVPIGKWVRFPWEV